MMSYVYLGMPLNLKVPEAIDAFTSPVEDIIIIVTHNSMVIYPIDGEK